MGRRLEVVKSTDERMALVRLGTVAEYLAVDESDMTPVMRSVRMSGLHGRYRKAGTEREYRF